nr:MAG TPA: Tail fiber protein [Bacteriophage sp.]
MLPQVMGRVESPDLNIHRYAPMLHPITESYDFGGVKDGDASQGTNAHIWKCRTDGRQIFIENLGNKDTRAGAEAAVALPISGTNITEVSFTVDQNARAVVAFVDNRLVKLYLYDNDVGKYTVKPYGTVFSPRVSLDDKREKQVANSDIILSYIEDTTLVARTQREKFQDRIEVQTGVGSAWFLRDTGAARDNTFRFWLYRRDAYEAETGTTYAP